MGWESAADVFEPVAGSLMSLRASDDVKRKILSDLVAALQDMGWTTERETLERFRDDPAIVKAFKDNNVTLSDDEV